MNEYENKNTNIFYIHWDLFLFQICIYPEHLGTKLSQLLSTIHFYVFLDVSLKAFLCFTKYFKHSYNISYFSFLFKNFNDAYGIWQEKFVLATKSQFRFSQLPEHI